MSQPIRGQGGPSRFYIDTKTTNLVDTVEFLRPVKFRQIPFSGVGEEFDSVSANKRSG